MYDLPKVPSANALRRGLNSRRLWEVNTAIPVCLSCLNPPFLPPSLPLSLYSAS